MEPHQLRVVKERDELNEKLVALQKFFISSMFSTVSEAEQYRLKRQADIMVQYVDVLDDRINNF